MRPHALLVLLLGAAACAGAPPRPCPVPTAVLEAPRPPPPGVVSTETPGVEPPVFLSGPMPLITEDVARCEIEGTAVVTCVVTAEGRVAACQVVQSVPGMDDVLVKTFEQHRYRPATLAGKPVAVFYNFKVTVRAPH